MYTSKIISEMDLLEHLRESDSAAFTHLFHVYYKDLVLFAGHLIKDVAVCEDIVQSIFIKLWYDRSELSITTSLKAYLLKSTRNACLDHIRHSAVKQEYGQFISFHSSMSDDSTEQYMLYSELQAQYQRALGRLTQMQRECFVLSRMEGLKYVEISERLGIAVRTVELRVSEALRLLKIYLKDFFILLPFLFYT